MSGFESVLTILNKTKSECLLAGDYNINLLKHEVHDSTRNFVNCLYDNSLISLITKPTRFGKSSSTLIDNIFTNKCNQNAISGILITDISDHLPNFYISKSEITSKLPKFFTSSSRHLTEPGLDALRAALNNTDWSFVDDCTNVNNAYTLFLERFNNLLNYNLPVVKITFRIYSKNHKPWISPGIIKYIRQKKFIV